MELSEGETLKHRLDVIFLQALTSGFTRPYPDENTFTGVRMQVNRGASREWRCGRKGVDEREAAQTVFGRMTKGPRKTDLGVTEIS